MLSNTEVTVLALVQLIAFLQVKILERFLSMSTLLLMTCIISCIQKHGWDLFQLLLVRASSVRVWDSQWVSHSLLSQGISHCFWCQARYTLLHKRSWHWNNFAWYNQFTCYSTDELVTTHCVLLVQIITKWEELFLYIQCGCWHQKTICSEVWFGRKWQNLTCNILGE